MARSNKILAPLFASVILAAACGGSSGTASDAGGENDSGTDGNDAGATDAGGSDAGPRDAGMSDAGNSDAGASDAGAGDAGSDAGTSTSPVILDSATAQIVGRRGRDLRLTIAAHDANQNISGAMVRLIDGSGNPILGFDSHQSGTLDSALGPAAFDTSTADAGTISTTATMSGFAAMWNTSPAQIAAVASVGISLRDSEGNASNEIVATVGAQSTAQNGSACDPGYVTSRCADTLYCSGSSPTCQPAPAPQISQLAYLSTDAGPLILIKGSEQADDLSNIHIDFEDGGGQPLAILLDGDNSAPVSSFDSAATGDANAGAFLVELQPAIGFDQICPQIAVTPSDVTGAAGSAASAKPVAIPVRSMGAACDTQGFDVCAANTVCAPAATGSATVCASLPLTQAAACKVAPELAPTVGASATTFGHTAKAALWNPPVGCSSDNPVGKPVGIATLHLATDAATLTLSTDNVGTNFDTILYLMPGCPLTSDTSPGCDDDGPNGATSLLTLQNVAAGDYTVAVGAFDSIGGSYQLTAEVQ